MNSIKNFMNLLESKWMKVAWVEMTLILKESHQYFWNIPANERELVLNVIFNERTGILTFLNNALNLNHNKNLERTIIQMFNLIIFIMTEFSNVYSPHIKSTQDVCTLALTMKASFCVKAAATRAFVVLIKTCPAFELDFSDTINKCVQKFKFCSFVERRFLLEVIATISKYFPQSLAFDRYAKTIRGQLMADMHMCDEAKTTRNYGIITYIEATNNLLYNFPPSNEDTGKSSGLDTLYRRLKDLSTSKDHVTNKHLISALVNLFSEHLTLFDEFIYKDYELWHSLLKSLVKRQLYGDAAIKALRIYYKIMGSVLERKNSENDKKVFLNLKNAFEESLSNARLGSTDLRLTVYGFSQIIEPCKTYFNEAGVEEIFSLIVHRTVPLYAREDDEATHFEDIADFQEALSIIIRYMPNVTIDQIRALTTLCSLLIKRFPELSITEQEYATSSLNRTIVNVRYTKEILYQEFISHIIYNGIVWSCSHMLFIDAALKRDEEMSLKLSITYKDYVHLWQGLLNPANYASSSQTGGAHAAVHRVVDEIITTCTILMHTLNLNVKAKENNVFSDVKVSQTVENESDFRIFLNLVDLYVEILANVEHFLWTNTLQKFLYEIIKHSYKNPLISGFYKLANVVLISSGAFDAAYVRNVSGETFNLVLRYVWDTLDSVVQYPQELQISCLQLILNVPEIFVKRIVEHALPAFKISFTIGLTNYEVATIALNALERWTKCLGSKCPKDFISKLVPCLDRFLQSEESSIKLLHDIEETKRRTVRKVTMLNDELSVEAFQKRILLFFGSLDSDVMFEFIHEKSLKTGATWSKKDLLKYSIPFLDMNLEISLDAMLPRIIELALSSGDRRTRVTASEVLHTVVALMLGKTVPSLHYDRDRFTSLYEILCPALLRLGCDSDNVIMQLYNPLLMQITHWLSSWSMRDSRAMVHLVNSLFDGLSDETNSSLRDISGICLAEFVHWSIKQSTDGDLARCPTNINLIIQRIINFALDPSPNKRVAAAIAFNHLYNILRENEEIVNIFWFEILHAFVKSLDGCNDSRIRDAILHVERVLLEKSEIFVAASSRRTRPPGFRSVRSEGAAMWIFERCGSHDRNCRKICMSLFESISMTVDGARTVITGYLKSDGLQGLNGIVLGDLDEEFRAISAESLENFLKMLDLYIWLLRERLVDHEALFSELNPSRNVIFNSIRNFVISTLLFTNSAVENRASIRPQEFIRLKTLRCEIVLTLFDFIPLLLVVKTIQQDFVPDYVFNGELFELVSSCLIKPHKVGFDSSNLQLTEELPLKLEGLLNSAIQNLPVPLMNSMKTVFATDIQRFSRQIFEFDEIIMNQVSISEKSIKGLILLHKCHLLKLCTGCKEITAKANIKLLKIFDTLRTKELGQSVCFYPKLEVKIYLERLVELLLLEYDTETMKVVLQLVTNATTLCRSDLTTTMTHGEYFLSVFKDVIIRGSLRDVEKTLNLLESSIHEDPDNVLRITEALVLYLQRHKTEYRVILDKSADLVMGKFCVFERAVNNLEHRRNVFLNIYAVVIRLKRTPLDVLIQRGDLYRWILKELVECNKFKYKIRLMRDFLVCLTDESSDDNPELRAILYNLKNERRITCTDDLGETEFAVLETVDCFQTLLTLLPITKSLDVFDAIINFALGAGKLLCEDKVIEYLKLYFSSIRTPTVLKSLELAYKRFMNATGAYDRFDVLFYFLLPSFGYCSVQTMETFFDRNIKEIYSIIMQKPTDILHDRQQLYVSKIGCYNLVEIMFANLPNDRINCKESPITINTVNETNVEETISKRIFRSTLPIRQLRVKEGDDTEIFRRMQCAAYNCSILIVSMTKDERFYVAVFGENPEKNQLIWENIVDVKRQYELRQTSKELPKERRKFINIRKSNKKTKNPHNYSYIKSYDLATSTLSDNMCAYDLNAVNLMPRTGESQRNETMSLTLEVDDLNDHECMAPICGLLIHMLNNEISQPVNGEVVSMLPKWMSQFRRSMLSKHANVRLFMLKIVLNTQAVFRPYADFFLEPIINTIYLLLKDGPLNYVITDALVMLVDWRDVSVPKTERGMNLARSMFSHLLEKGSAAPTKYIVRYNMEIIEKVVGAWYECLQVPEGLKTRMSSMDRLAIRLVLIFLTNQMAEKIINRDDVWEYLQKCLAEWKIEEESVLQSFEAVGLMLKYSEDTENVVVEMKYKIVEISKNAFRSMLKQNPGRLVKCVHALCKPCPNLTEEFYPFISSIQVRVGHANIAKCLEVFSLIIPRLSPENIVKELNYMQFNGLLEIKVLSCEKICLQIIEQLVPILESTHLLPIVKLMSRYSEHEFLDYRQICYGASIELYKKYFNNESQDFKVVEIMNISKRILLSGLLDPAENMQTLAMDFWLDTAQMSGKCPERLLDILDTFTPGVEKHFLSLMTLMFLQMTKKSENYEKAMFEPLHNCRHYDQDISVSWTTGTLESRIPLFAPSLARQWNQRFTQYSYAMGSFSYDQDAQHDFMLRATNSPQFEATFIGKPSLPGNMSEEGIFAIPKVPEIPKNKMSRRFLANWSDNNPAIQKNQAAKQFKAEEYRREYLRRQRSSVKLYRKYRIGDFPDIVISQAMVLGPMQQLVKKDSTICKNLIVFFIRSLINRMRDSGINERYCCDLSEKLISILKKRRRNGAVIPAILEILFNIRELKFPWEVVMEVARTDGLFAQGALLIERSLIYGTGDSEPPAKRSRVENPVEDENMNQWIDLAGLYESMDEVDVVLSIFRGEMFSKDLHIASAARATANWEKAEIAYRKAWETETGAQMKRHCLQGMFECMSRLTKWNKLESEIDSKVKPNIESLLECDDAHNERWFAPWIFRAHTHRILEGRANDVFVNALQSYLQNATKCQRLKELFSEETAVIVIKDTPDISRDFLNSCCEKLRGEWIQLSPLAVPLRAAAIVKLQGIHDIDCYLNTIESSDIVESSRALLNSWQNSGPSISDDLPSCEKHLSYTAYFISCLINKLNGSDSQEGTEIVEKLRSVRVKKMLNLVDFALNQRNGYVAKKYLRTIEREVNDCNFSQNLIDSFELNTVRCKYLNAEMSRDSVKSLRFYATSWGKAHEILCNDGLSNSSQIAVRQIISTMALSLAKLATHETEFFNSLTAQSQIVQDIFTERIFDNLTDALNYYSFSNLNRCCTIASEIGDCHLRLTKHCYERISTCVADSQISRQFVCSTLRAMSCGSEEATHYFPCLLREEILANEETRQIFQTESSNLETWRFLIWQTQLLSHLGTSIGNLVLPIIMKMIKVYPNALVYSLHLILDTKPHLRNDPSILSLTNLLEDKREFDGFLEAIQYVVQPELHLEYHLKELVRNLSQGKATVVDALMKKVYLTIATCGGCLIQGNIYRTIAPYKQEIERIIEMKMEDIEKYVLKLLIRLRQSLQQRTDKTKLQDYSPWLHDFVGRDIEVPGQYTGEKKPMPRYHAKIVKIESAVKVMQSKRKPIRITMVANNAKKFRFLVKFGEDLRLDQRVEQIFDVMNKALEADVACSHRRLSIDTYQVFPLSGSLGFLQWVNGTKTLSDYIYFSLDDSETIKRVVREHEEWIAKAAPDKCSSAQYKEALVKYTSANVLAKMTDFNDKFGWDLLRRTFVLLSPSMESFMSLRKNFTTSYAAMCIVQWILGIGDRHLGNTLISVESGRSLGIDFGSAFGGAVDQPVPELIPFRLTAQIRGLLKPFNENDLMGATMTHVLRALRNRKDLLLACLDVVAHEQLNWEEHANKLSEEMQSETVGIKWLPAKKVTIVTKKLNGVKPSSITLEQLAERHSDMNYFSRYTAVVNGTDSDNKSRRSFLNGENLSPEEQVQCLIEQATDLNVLGRTYAGWTPWL